MKTPDGKYILCDGSKCEARAYLSIGLRTGVATSRNSRRSGVEGWLFVARADGNHHFCPICGKLYLRQLTDGS